MGGNTGARRAAIVALVAEGETTLVARRAVDILGRAGMIPGWVEPRTSGVFELAGLNTRRGRASDLADRSMADHRVRAVVEVVSVSVLSVSVMMAGRPDEEVQAPHKSPMHRFCQMVADGEIRDPAAGTKEVWTLLMGGRRAQAEAAVAPGPR